jgi:cytochrome oxidase Cu insertion factor (SCO1/SenC/PrrC family)
MACWPKARSVVLSLLVLSLPTWSYGQGQGDGAVDVRALTLLDQDGRPVSLRTFEGRTLVLNFIFTHCVVACHTQVKSLNAVRAALPPDIRARVQFLSVSIDPSRDTPETLRQYARTMGIDDPDWRFATMSPNHVAQIVRAFGVKRELLPDGQMDHTLMVILFDAKGQLVQRYARAEVDSRRLVREIGEVVRLFDPAYQSASPIDQGR